MTDQPQYDVEQALEDCLADITKLRKQMSRNLPAQAVPPLAEALVKLRGEALLYWLRIDAAAKLAEGTLPEPAPSTPGSLGNPDAEGPPVDDPGEPGETMPPEAEVPDPDAGEGGAE